ncbi:MAG: DUF222 domain-containing protein [Candidatus Rokubacteria bacterium]|nr:DUF222 domain-containing protein [Candidatus Rokubacteria bacterium]
MQMHAPAIVATPSAAAELDRLGDQIAELSAQLDAATARLLDLIREFDALSGWNSGFRSCAAWLSWPVGLDLGAARERVRVARALGTLPLLAQALARGELSYAKVRALTRVATPETEARLLTVGRGGTAAHVERIVRGWRRVDRQAEARESARQHAGRALHVYQDEDGMVVVRGRLEPEVGALLVRALDAARETLYQRARSEGTTTPPVNPSADPPSKAQQQADALALLAESALHHELDPGTAGERYQVVVHVDAPVLADPEQPGQSVLEDGAHVSAETSRRLACEASRVVMRHEPDGRVVEIGARTRTIPPALRRALKHRDLGCRFPGCGVRVGQALKGDRRRGDLDPGQEGNALFHRHGQGHVGIARHVSGLERREAGGDVQHPVLDRVDDAGGAGLAPGVDRGEHGDGLALQRLPDLAARQRDGHGCLPPVHRARCCSGTPSWSSRARQSD